MESTFGSSHLMIVDNYNCNYLASLILFSSSHLIFVRFRSSKLKDSADWLHIALSSLEDCAALNVGKKISMACNDSLIPNFPALKLCHLLLFTSSLVLMTVTQSFDFAVNHNLLFKANHTNMSQIKRSISTHFNQAIHRQS